MTLAGTPAQIDMGRQIGGDHGSRSDHGAITDRDARRYHGVGSEPYVIADADGRIAVRADCESVHHGLFHDWRRRSIRKGREARCFRS